MVCELLWVVFFFQAEDGIRDLVRSRGLGDVYKRQGFRIDLIYKRVLITELIEICGIDGPVVQAVRNGDCLLYTSDAADERSSVDLGGRRIIKKKKQEGSKNRAHIGYKRTE